MSQLKLYMLMLGCKPPGRHIEQHDVFFGIAGSLGELVPEIKAFWPQPGRIHIDAWREVTAVDGYQISVSLNREADDNPRQSSAKLFFINLGGYQANKFEEQHFVVLTVKEDKAAAFKGAKETLFFKTNHFDGANSHIDDKYGLDVDDLYQIEEMLTPEQKDRYQIAITPAVNLKPDEIALGYFKLESL